MILEAINSFKLNRLDICEHITRKIMYKFGITYEKIRHDIFNAASIECKLQQQKLSKKKEESGREHLLESFDAFLDLYVNEGGKLSETSLSDMIKWCCVRCGNEHKEKERTCIECEYYGNKDKEDECPDMAPASNEKTCDKFKEKKRGDA